MKGKGPVRSYGPVWATHRRLSFPAAAVKVPNLGMVASSQVSVSAYPKPIYWGGEWPRWRHFQNKGKMKEPTETTCLDAIQGRTMTEKIDNSTMQEESSVEHSLVNTMLKRVEGKPNKGLWCLWRRTQP